MWGNESPWAAGCHQLLPVIGIIGDGNAADALDGVQWINDVLFQDALSGITGARLNVNHWKLTHTASSKDALRWVQVVIVCSNNCQMVETITEKEFQFIVITPSSLRTWRCTISTSTLFRRCWCRNSVKTTWGSVVSSSADLNFLQKISTVDETLVFLYNPQSKWEYCIFKSPTLNREKYKERFVQYIEAMHRNCPKIWVAKDWELLHYHCHGTLITACQVWYCGASPATVFSWSHTKQILPLPLEGVSKVAVEFHVASKIVLQEVGCGGFQKYYEHLYE